MINYNNYYICLVRNVPSVARFFLLFLILYRQHNSKVKN